MDVDEEWQMFLENENVSFVERQLTQETPQKQGVNGNKSYEEVPECEELSISTKTKVLYLNTLI